MPPSLVWGCSRTCEAVSSCRDSKRPESVPRATSVTGTAASVTANPPPLAAEGGMPPPRGETLPCENNGSAFLGKAELPARWLWKATMGSEPRAAPFYTAHLAPGFLHQHRGRAGANVIQPSKMAATSLSPENTHFTQNKAEG